MQPIITLCGSTKFKTEFLSVAQRLGEKGWLVISLTNFTHADTLDTTKETEAMLDAIHMQKIMMSDSIYVINKDGYIGEATLRAIAFAIVLRKSIIFFELPASSIKSMMDTIKAEYGRLI